MTDPKVVHPATQNQIDFHNHILHGPADMLSQDNFGATRGPTRFQLVRRDGKWDKQNRTTSGLYPSGVDLPRSEPEAELLSPETKSNWKRIQLLGHGFLAPRLRGLAGNNRLPGT